VNAIFQTILILKLENGGLDYLKLISDIGVKGVWNDMNEPAVMEVPNKHSMDVRHDYDGNPCSHRKAHNIYGTQMARATYHGVKRFAYPKRPFIITDLLMQGRNATVPLGPEIM
jgi:alpha-glucosidase (family GH31 glycosyl hydrolase)